MNPFKPLLKHMRRFNFFLFLSLWVCTTSFGQETNAEGILKSYLTALRKANVDTFAMLDWGCAGCAMAAKDSMEAVQNPRVVYVLSQQRAKYTLFKIDEQNRTSTRRVDSCELFRFILQQRPMLRKKDAFYKREMARMRKASPFSPPGPTHYTYERLSFRIGAFTYKQEIKDDDSDHMGVKRDQKDWFIATRAVIAAFRKILTERLY